MRESKKYIRYFISNSVILSSFIFISTILSLIYIYSQPVKYTTSQLFEVQNANIDKSVLLADQIVNYLRSENLHAGLNLSKNSTLNSYKTGPFAFTVETTSVGKENSVQDSKEIYIFISNKYSVKELGSVYTNKDSVNYIYPFTIIFIGSLLGLFISLTVTYFKKY